MRSLATVLALVLTVAAGDVASATPRPRSERGVTITSAEDASPGSLDRRARTRHGDIVRQALLDVLDRAGADVRRGRSGQRQIDVSVVSWRVTPRSTEAEVSAEVRIVVCDSNGKMLSIVTGRATVSGARTQLVQLREQALAAAVGGMSRSLQAQLVRAVS